MGALHNYKRCIRKQTSTLNLGEPQEQTLKLLEEYTLQILPSTRILHGLKVATTVILNLTLLEARDNLGMKLGVASYHLVQSPFGTIKYNI